MFVTYKLGILTHWKTDCPDGGIYG